MERPCANYLLLEMKEHVVNAFHLRVLKNAFSLLDREIIGSQLTVQ
jgi:hypothetical protein